jgi:hypothetical protein
MAPCILNFRHLDKNTLRASFDVELPSGMILCGCMLHEKGDKRWIGLPAKPYVKQDGSQSWAKIVDFVDRDTGDKFQKAVLRAVIDIF